MNRTWYRNVLGPSRYHLAREDWIRSGRAVCGADIKSPAYTAEHRVTADGLPHPAGRCGHCSRWLERQEARRAT